jgi:hypothetical protein
MSQDDLGAHYIMKGNQSVAHAMQSHSKDRLKTSDGGTRHANRGS